MTIQNHRTNLETIAVADEKTSVTYDRSTASLVLGIIGIFPCSLIALVMGYKTRKAYDMTISAGATPLNLKGKLVSRGVATAGFVLGIINLSLFVVWIAVAVGTSGS